MAGTRIVDLPNLGAVTDSSAFVAELAGSGRHLAPALRTWMLASTILATRGSTARTLQDRFADVVRVADFGAVADATTDDATAINAALASALPGQEVWLSGRGRHYCASSITVPKGVTLRAGWDTPGNTTASYLSGQPTDLTTLNGALILATTATVTLNSSASIKGVPIYRSGLTTPATDSSAFAGTAITIAGDDTYVGYCLILGFAQAYLSKGTGNWHDRQKIEWVYGDNQAGILIDNSHDTPYISHCHFWPYCTYYSAATLSAHQRTGTAFDVTSSDLISISFNFSFSYKIGYHIAADGGAVLIDCQADGIYNLASGFVFESVSGSGVQGTKVIGCTVYGNTGTTTSAGYVIAPPTYDYIEFIGCSSNGTSTAYSITTGDVRILGGSVYGSIIGVTVSSSSSIVVLCAGFRAENITTAVVNNAGGGGGVYIAPDCDFTRINLGGGTAGVSSNVAPFIIASASPMVLPPSFNVFQVTGTTSFTTMSGGWAGRVVTLIFTGALTITSFAGTNGVALAGGRNLLTASGTTINLVFNGTTWYEPGTAQAVTSLLANAVTGTTAGGNAAAGVVGEYISSSTAGPGTSLTTGTNANVTSISLTAGDWDVWGTVVYNPGATTTIANVQGWISTTSAAPFGLPGGGAQFSLAATLTTGNTQAIPVGTTRLSLGSTTTVYLGALAVFGTSTMGASGFIGARRVR